MSRIQRDQLFTYPAAPPYPGGDGSRTPTASTTFITLEPNPHSENAFSCALLQSQSAETPAWKLPSAPDVMLKDAEFNTPGPGLGPALRHETATHGGVFVTSSSEVILHPIGQRQSTPSLIPDGERGKALREDGASAVDTQMEQKPDLRVQENFNSVLYWLLQINND